MNENYKYPELDRREIRDISFAGFKRSSGTTNISFQSRLAADTPPFYVYGYPEFLKVISLRVVIDNGTASGNVISVQSGPPSDPKLLKPCWDYVRIAP